MASDALTRRATAELLREYVGAPASGIETFTHAGTHGWVCPDGLFSVTIKCWGAGAAGRKGGASLGGPGGGAGAYVEKVLTVVPGTTYSLHVGMGGPKGITPGGEQPGEDSWFGSTATVLAKGGSIASSATVGGSGGSVPGSIGTIRQYGGSGGNSPGSSGNGAGGGAAGGSGQDGANGSDANGSPGAGGVAIAGGGKGGDGSASNLVGMDGSAPGGAGGGGGINASGGAGGTGQVVVIPM